MPATRVKAKRPPPNDRCTLRQPQSFFSPGRQTDRQPIAPPPSRARQEPTSQISAAGKWDHCRSRLIRGTRGMFGNVRVSRSDRRLIRVFDARPALHPWRREMSRTSASLDAWNTSCRQGDTDTRPGDATAEPTPNSGRVSVLPAECSKSSNAEYLGYLRRGTSTRVRSRVGLKGRDKIAQGPALEIA